MHCIFLIVFSDSVLLIEMFMQSAFLIIFTEMHVLHVCFAASLIIGAVYAFPFSLVCARACMHVFFFFVWGKGVQAMWT